MAPGAPAPPVPAPETGRSSTVAVDGLGAERGPGAICEGVRRAAADGIGVRVFGRPEELAELAGIEGVEVVEARDLIANDEDPVRAVRSRSEASIVRAAADVASGSSHALASPGSTGATMAASLFALKRLRGVQRPALAVQIPAPGLERPVLLLDAGANSEARASHLLQFAYLGSAFAAAVLDAPEPRVGLLSVGEEAKKGSALVVEAHAALAEAEGLVFAGNVEGRDLLSGAVDVVVTDGFTGNVALKTIEGAARAVGDAVRAAARSGPIAMAGGLLLRGSLGALRATLDPDNTGGAILLGLRGVAIVGHGSAGPEGIANQIRLAAHSASQRVPERIGELLRTSGSGRAAIRERSGRPVDGGGQS